MMRLNAFLLPLNSNFLRPENFNTRNFSKVTDSHLGNFFFKNFENFELSFAAFFKSGQETSFESIKSKSAVQGGRWRRTKAVHVCHRTGNDQSFKFCQNETTLRWTLQCLTWILRATKFYSSSRMSTKCQLFRKAPGVKFSNFRQILRIFFEWIFAIFTFLSKEFFKLDSKNIWNTEFVH